jgi:hypothetical protein
VKPHLLGTPLVDTLDAPEEIEDEIGLLLLVHLHREELDVLGRPFLQQRRHPGTHDGNTGPRHLREVERLAGLDQASTKRTFPPDGLALVEQTPERLSVAVSWNLHAPAARNIDVL